MVKRKDSVQSKTPPRKHNQRANMKKVRLFYNLREKLLVPFLVRDILKNRKEEFLKVRVTKGVSKSKKATNRKKAVEVSEDEVSHGEEWSGWDNQEN